MHKKATIGTQTTKPKWPLFLGAAGILVFIGVLMYAIIPRPVATFPLGDNLEYVGSTHSGTIRFLSDSSPSASYYYATDMSIQDIVNYFKKAKLDKSYDSSLIYPPTESIDFSLKANSTSNPINIFYYVDGSEQINDFDLKRTPKKHLVIIQDEDYQAAKDSL